MKKIVFACLLCLLLAVCNQTSFAQQSMQETNKTVQDIIEETESTEETAQTEQTTIQESEKKGESLPTEDGIQSFTSPAKDDDPKKITSTETAGSIKQDKKTAVEKPLSDFAKAEEKATTAPAAKAPDTASKKNEKKALVLRAAHNDVITEIKALLENGSGPVENVSRWQVFMLRAKFALPDGKIKEGDTTVVTLPDELRFFSMTDFEIKDDDGNVVAHAVVNGADKTLTLTYTNYPETHSGVKGNFHFYVRIDGNVVTEETEIPLVFDVSGETVIGGSIHYEGPKDPSPSFVGKSGEQIETDEPRHLRYQVTINTMQKDLKNIVFQDHIQTSGITYDKDSVQIKKGHWKIVNGDWWLIDEHLVTNDYSVEWSEDGTTFSIDFGDISSDEGLVIRYTATSEYDLADGEHIKNGARLSGSNIETTQTYGNITYHVAGGSAEGYVYKLKIKKQNSSGEALSGAVFKVIRIANDAEAGVITTDKNGEAEIGGLLLDRYKIVEDKPPAGYKPLTEPVIVDVSDFNDEKTAIKTIENNLDTIDIPVEKNWVGPPQEKVTVRLLADEAPIDKAVLTAEKNWGHVFRDHPKYDQTDGHEIKYDVIEDDVDGYIQGKSGTVESGFTFTNTISDKVSVPVTKTWTGSPADKVTITLYADGMPADSVDLSDETGWQHTFTDLEKYKDGKEIQYTVKETAVPGYTTDISGTAQKGFYINNTSTETKAIKVIKRWVGGRSESVKIRLYADEVEIADAKIKESSGWEHSFNDLPVYTSDGQIINYTISEDPLKGYTSKLDYGGNDCFIVTNTKKADVSSQQTSGNEGSNDQAPGSEEPDRQTSKSTKSGHQGSGHIKSNSPRTGDSAFLFSAAAMLLLAIAAAGMIWVYRRKKNCGLKK